MPWPTMDSDGEPPLERERRLVGTLDRESPESAISLAEASERHLRAIAANGASRATLNNYGRVERAYLAWLALPDAPLSALNLWNAREWLMGLRLSNRYQASSIKVYTTILKVWAHWLETEDVFEDSPLRKFRIPRARPTVIEIFTPDDVAALIAAAESGACPERDVALIYFLLDTMVRASELCEIRSHAALLDSGSITVVGKGAKPRRIHYEPETGARLVRYLATRTDSEPWLFLNSQGRPLSRERLGSICQGWGKTAGIRIRCSPHTFRHTGAVRFLQAHPGHIAQLKTRLGHEALDMTLRYAGRAAEDAILDGVSSLSVAGLERAAARKTALPE